jgi:cytochrome bd-type quinol oxidase subunit 1
VAATLIGFVLLYGLLGASGFYLIARKAKKGPPSDEEALPKGAAPDAHSAAA